MIVVALFIVALVATMAYVMMFRLERDTRRTSLILRNTEAEFLAQGSIAWAMDDIRMNWEKQKPNHIVDLTPIRSPIETVNGYQVSSIIYDMQGRFNLNSLADIDSQAEFDRLIRLLDPKVSQDEARKIVQGVFDWISPAAQDNEYSKYYAELPSPYRAAHRPMLSISELRLVKGVTPQLFNALQPYVTALPATAKINIQSAPAPVIASLSPSMSLQIADTIVNMRKLTPFKNVKAFSDLEAVKSFKIPTDKLVITSSYFWLIRM